MRRGVGVEVSRPDGSEQAGVKKRSERVRRRRSLIVKESKKVSENCRVSDVL
jgi:hypothetical protein